ncbi:hypothetical protein SAMN02745134_02785 [Clostridium acidisoli DSM 12555]|uniref:Uncharacterized protein n=1 Tax=Clostridium acidisoli DSM 12555 TaxID=1121291 RepID=A0A1W1XR22_9CLOT|nr:hypothetical protein SAMN02745134_02785 [Clostridium acidisoli DSM 12555]
MYLNNEGELEAQIMMEEVLHIVFCGKKSYDYKYGNDFSKVSSLFSKVIF